MDKIWKEKWLKALRSGEYKQGIYCLRQDSIGEEKRYCCLGVLCDIYGKENGIEFKESKDINGDLFLGHKDYIPEIVSKETGLLKREVLTDNITEEDLSQINDKEGKSFDEIADFIEKNL